MSKRKHKAERKAAKLAKAERQGKRLHELRQQVRLYEAATSSDWRPMRGANMSADTVMNQGGTRLRDAARYADENDGVAIAVLDDLLDNVVGAGRPVQPMVRLKNGSPAVKVNEALRKAWHSFWEQPEVTGELPGSEVERLAHRAWFRDGEVFPRHVFAPRSAELPNSQGYLLQLLESDFVPYDLHTSSARGTITHGVEKNRWGRPVAYHVYEAHPGGQLVGDGASGRIMRIPADDMSHLKFTRRLHQTRGVTVLHAALTTLQDLREAWESERIAMRIAAAMTAFVRKTGDYQPSSKAAAEIADSSIGARAFEIAPGMVWDNLLPGEEVGTISTDRPNTNFDPFTLALHRTVAGGTGTRVSAISHRYDGNYSAQRQELVEGAISYRRLFALSLGVFYRPIYRRAADMAILRGDVQLHNRIDLETLYEIDVPPPALPWIDQQKEIAAYTAAIEAKLIARHQAIRELGRDPVLVDQMIAEEAERAAELAAAMPSPPPPQPTDDAAADDDQGVDQGVDDEQSEDEESETDAA